ncbi:4'-phosphopantetheinyl transferase family protein [Sorangium sp. So ce394]|uniref:4'-phosphopantetheinyl transferase family protein n=1 Tax=Sorangium sp. So ce394 TaxID=3133310 RepID=UPI003F5BE428
MLIFRTSTGKDGTIWCVVRAPSPLIVGALRPHWTTAEVAGCPFGVLVAALCPGRAPDEVVASLDVEEQAYANALPSSSRRSEWLGGRLCLAKAIARCSTVRSPMLSTTSGAAVLPEGLAGSVSHKGAVAVALAAQVRGGLGVDVECISERDASLERKVLTAAERARLRERTDISAAQYVTAHFSLKEAIYKALEPKEQMDLEFDDIDIQLVTLTQQVWLSPAVKLLTRQSVVRTGILLDGDWVLAAALREPCA